MSGQQWFKARLAGLSDGERCKYTGAALERARERLQPFVEQAGYTYKGEERTPLGIGVSVYKSNYGPIYLHFSCHHHRPPDCFGFCMGFRFQPGIGDIVKGLFNRSMPADRMIPENDLGRVVTALRQAGIAARPWLILIEDDDLWHNL